MSEELSMDQAFIKKLTDVIETNLEDEQFGVSELAEAVSLSRSQLHRKLQSINGKSASQFIREFRLQKAMALLQSNVATGSEIAYRVGFSSPTYFNASFKEFYGYPPGEVKLRASLTNDSNNKVQVLKESSTTVTIKRKLFNLRTYVIAALAVVLVITIAYFNYSKSETVTSTETEENKSSNPVEHSIAVLPFKNMSGSPDNEAFCDGMTNAIISRLSKIKDIEKVISQTTMMSYKDNKKAMPVIADELKVHYILESGFQKSGNKIKINLQLIDGPNDKLYWSEEYEVQYDSIFKIQAEVAENVAKNMNTEISDIEYEAIQKIPTKNIEAYQTFLKAEYIKGQLNKAAFKEAIPLYEKAIALDPNFTEAYIGFGRYWSVGGLFFGIFDEQLAWKNAKLMYERALELDPTNSQVAYELHMGYFYYDWNFVAVQKYFKENNFWDVDFYLKIGKYDEVLKDSENQLKKFPYNTIFYLNVSWASFFLNDLEKSHEILDFSRDMFTKDLHYLMESSRLYYYLGDYKSSKNLLNILMNNFEDRPPLIIWVNAVLANVNGNNEAEKKYVDQLNQQYHTNVSGSPAWFIALYFAHIKDYDKTFEWLQKSFDRHEVEMTWLKEEPLLRPVRKDSRYIKLYNLVGFSKIAPITPVVD